MGSLKFLRDREDEFDSRKFINELYAASKSLGILEEKINAYKFENILVPLLNKKEAISSMYIEGTQTTISSVLEEEINEDSERDRTNIETNNHSKALFIGTSYLNQNDFNHEFIKKLHEILLKDIVPKNKEETIGKYKTKDNFIVNSVGTVVFSPPSFKETQKYMDEIIDYMNDTKNDINPLIKTAIIHSQFESIHPFDDGNGRIGRLLITLCLYKYKVIKIPFFYISEAISQEKTIYYSKLMDARKNDFTEWIKFFLKMCVVQAEKHIRYIDNLNMIYDRTRDRIKRIINTQKYEQIISCIFTQPIVNSEYLAKKINVSLSQARKYLVALENANILEGDDKTRGRKYYFTELLDLLKNN